jgi:N-acetylglucosamine-6-phosphate deacetylase
MMTLTPAKISNVDHITGSLSIGKDADIVIFDEDIDIKANHHPGNIIKNFL